jgi:hypothetical protein
MELADFNAKTQALLALFPEGADQGEATNILAELTTGFSEEIAAKVSAQNTATDLTNKNNKLKEDNMKLFLQVTVPQTTSSSDPIRPENDPDPINALFNGGRLNLKG